jgi:predicted AAA+ superfamily ATPase
MSKFTLSLSKLLTGTEDFADLCSVARRFVRAVVGDVERGLRRKLPLLQVLIGPRQSGKTTAAGQIADRWPGAVVQASADVPVPPGSEWIETHWERARRAAAERPRRPVLLVLDEMQKVRGWTEAVKALWDEDRKKRTAIRVLLLGSSALSVQAGLAESLAGRFFLHRCPHWSYAECARAFGWDLDRWIFFGGYPAAARLIRDEAAWQSYIADSLVETAIARDVLTIRAVGKPVLLRHLFAYAAQHPAEIVSFNKMLGTLQDAGNTVTLAHYLELLAASFLVSGLERLTGRPRERGSSPKIVVWNNALISALSGLSYREARDDPAWWGRLVENAFGAHLLNSLAAPRFTVGYFRQRNDEVDYVVIRGRSRVGIEVKSGRPDRGRGIDAFRRRFPAARVILVGASGIPVDEAFRTPAEKLVGG